MKKKNKSYVKFIVTAGILFLLLGVGVISATVFRVDKENIHYSGSTRYTDEELTDKIFGSHVNSLLYYVMQSGKQEKIPFVQKYDVEIQWPRTMSVTVYEKPVIGYIGYMGSNMYFDKDGYVVESSPEVIKGVPQITGIKFQSIVLNSRLEVDDERVFELVLELTQAFDKYDLEVDRLYFDGSLDVTLYMGDVKVLLGDCSDLIEKIHELKEMSTQLVGMKGVLHMENYTDTTPKVIFKKENV